MIDIFTKCDKEYGQRVADGLLKISEKKESESVKKEEKETAVHTAHSRPESSKKEDEKDREG